VTNVNRVAIFTNEYPPYTYGGAGVHVEYLARELARLVPVEVRCFGDQRVERPDLTVRGYEPWADAKTDTDPRFGGAFDALFRNLGMARDRLAVDIVHTHTWYTAMAGFMAKKFWEIPHVLTTHSLEPLRPWKVEQLGAGYHMSCWVEKNALEAAEAVIAVSRETRQDILNHFDIDPGRIHVIHNGIDLDEYRRTKDTAALTEYGVDTTRPYVLFVGRITRQKGIIHLVNAIPHIRPELQVVLLAGAPDTPEIRQEMEERVAAVSAGRAGVIWVQEMLPKPKVIQFYSNAAVFCCPSVYEPFGIINLEAMATETAVVASAVGGIKEVVVPEETGLLVDLALQPGTFEPTDAAGFSRDLAAAINRVGLDEGLQQRFGRNGRRRVEEHFSWTAIARKTLELYESLI